MKQETFPVPVRKTLKIAVCVGFVLTVLLSFTGFAALTSECEQISDQVLRLHILANSDSEADQALKLAVRDRILEEGQTLFRDAHKKEDAIAQATECLPQLRQAALDEIKARGFDYDVQVSLGKVFFNTRHYEAITLPAGHYDALQIRIGKAQGKNWWCVLFPSLCVPSASNVTLDDVLNPEQMELVENAGHHEVKFKVVEWYEGIRSWFS